MNATPAKPEKTAEKNQEKAAEKVKADSKTPASPSRGKIYASILETIGATPLIRMPRFSAHHKLEADLLAKLEFFNPLASVKDRTALAMFEAAERAGKITPGKTHIVETTGGNLGVSLAFVAAHKGYKITIVMPENSSFDRRKIIAFFGAEVIVTPADKGSKGAMEKAKAIMEKTGGDSYMFHPFDNMAAVDIHAATTAEELWTDTGGGIDILVSAAGTGATITGIAKVLRARKPGFKAYAVEPAESPVLSGGKPAQHKIEGIGPGFIPAVMDLKIIDGVVQVASPRAYEVAREVAKIEAIPGGISSGAALAAALDIARLPDSKGKMIVAILPSFAERYLSTPLFDEPMK